MKKYLYIYKFFLGIHILISFSKSMRIWPLLKDWFIKNQAKFTSVILLCLVQFLMSQCLNSSTLVIEALLYSISRKTACHFKELRWIMVEKYLLSFTVWNVFKSSFDASCVELQFLTPEMSLIAFMSLITNAHAIDIGHSNQWSSTLSLRYSIYSICIRDGYEPTKTSQK